MGGGSSSSAQKHLGNSQNNVVQLMMPLYYNSEDVTHEERQLASDSWQLILTDKSPEFTARKGTEGFDYSSSVIFFYDTFYARLFDIHPMARALFKSGMKSQGKFLVQMLSLSLSELEDKPKFEKSLIKLAEIHNIRGVKAVEYGIVGDVLFWVLRRVLGQDYYNVDLHYAWVKIYSRMLRTIVPVAVAMELKDGSAQVTRLTIHSDSKMFEASRSRENSPEHSAKHSVTLATSSNSTTHSVNGHTTGGTANGYSPGVFNTAAMKLKIPDDDRELTCERIRNSESSKSNYVRTPKGVNN